MHISRCIPLDQLFGYFTVIIYRTDRLPFFNVHARHIWRKLNVSRSQPLPLLGNTFKSDFGLARSKGTYDRIYSLRIKNSAAFDDTPFLMVRDPELINKELVKDFHRPRVPFGSVGKFIGQKYFSF